MMKGLLLIASVLFLFTLTACDYSSYVSVRNYGEARRVRVTYQQFDNTFSDTDTLAVRDLDSSSFHRSLIRTNLSSNSYSFIAPGQTEIPLQPRSLGWPIKKVEILSSADSLWTTCFGTSRKEFRRLKKAGLVTAKGFLFTHAVVVQVKK